VALLLGGGFRRSELASLTLRERFEVQVDEEEGFEFWVAEVDAKGRNDDGSKKRRRVPISPVAMETLADYLEGRGLPRDPRRCPLGTPAIAGLEADGLRHATGAATPLSIYRALKFGLEDCARSIAPHAPDEAAELRRVTPHWLRHSFGWAMAATGVHMTVMQAALGHADSSTTSIYSGAAMQTQARALRQLWGIGQQTQQRRVP
jgi:site-specific recombinase XerD